MDVGVVMGIGVGDGIDDRARLLCRGRGIEVGQRLARARRALEDREIGAPRRAVEDSRFDWLDGHRRG